MQPYLRTISKKLLIGIGLLFFIYSCSDKTPVSPKYGLTKEQKAAISYFDAICLGFEYGDAPKVTRKWKKDVKIFIGGKPNKGLRKELGSIINELNSLIKKSNISLGVVADSAKSNAYLFFGAGKKFAKEVPAAEPYIAQNFGLFFVNYNNNNELTNAYIYIDIFRTRTEREKKHLLREELTQSLGLARDSKKYSNSIFQASYQTKVTEYARIDKQIIRLLYDPRIKTGLNKREVNQVLRTIIGDYVPS